jgi:hypothetical protein
LVNAPGVTKDIMKFLVDMKLVWKFTHFGKDRIKEKSQKLGPAYPLKTGILRLDLTERFGVKQVSVKNDLGCDILIKNGAGYKNLGMSCVTNFLVKKDKDALLTVDFRFEDSKIEFCKDYLPKYNPTQPIMTTLNGFLHDKYRQWQESEQFVVDLKYNHQVNTSLALGLLNTVTQNRPIQLKKVHLELKALPSNLVVGKNSSIEISIKNVTKFLKVYHVSWPTPADDCRIMFIGKTLLKTTLHPNKCANLTFQILPMEGGLATLPKIRVFEKQPGLK